MTAVATPRTEPAVTAPPAKATDWRDLAWRVGLPAGVFAACLLTWQLALVASPRYNKPLERPPTPMEVAAAMVELAEKGLLVKYSISSLFRVTWAYLAAVVLGVPLGLLMGWFARAYQALNPLVQVLRPISPIAWMSLSIMWFGISEAAPIFLIFIASLFSIAVTATAAVRNIQTVYLRAAQNFGLSKWEMFRRVILPATLPQLLTGMRITLGIAWLVVVAAEMIVNNPKAGGLGFLIIDAGNQGARYDLVVAGMLLIGVIGLILDLLVRQLERFDEVRWGYGQR